MKSLEEVKMTMFEYYLTLFTLLLISIFLIAGGITLFNKKILKKG